MTTAQKLQKVAEDLQNVHDAGVRKAEKACRDKHFSTVVTGDGSPQMILPIGFEPDFIEIASHDPAIRAVRGVISLCQLDLSALGQIAGMFCITTGPSTGTGLGTYTNVLAAATGVSDKYKRRVDGSISIGNLGYETLQGVWGNGVDYLVTAVKCVTKSDKERITEVIERLPEGGTYKIHINKAKKDKAFTEAEWKALIAQKSTYTFVMV